MLPKIYTCYSEIQALKDRDLLYDTLKEARSQCRKYGECYRVVRIYDMDNRYCGYSISNNDYVISGI